MLTWPADPEAVASLEQKLASAASRQRKLTAENTRLREQLREAQQSLAAAQERASAAAERFGTPELQLLERLLAPLREPGGRRRPGQADVHGCRTLTGWAWPVAHAKQAARGGPTPTCPPAQPGRPAIANAKVQSLAERRALGASVDDHKLGWGIVGLGRIASTEIAPAIATSGNGVLISVASRDQGRAEDFARTHGAAAAATITRDARRP